MRARPREFALVQCDQEVTDVRWLSPGESPGHIEVKGRRGTQFQPAFDWIAANMDADVIVYATDLDCRQEYRDPGIPVIWLTTSRHRTAPFGETVRLAA
jgi:predicted metal-dependent peptidase